jgi:hypothetical protein
MLWLMQHTRACARACARTRVRAQVSQLVATDVEYKDRLFVGNVHLVRMQRTTDGTAFRRRHYTRRTLRVPRRPTE